MQTIKEIHEYLSQRLRIKEEDMRLWLYNSEVSMISESLKSWLSVKSIFHEYGILSIVIMLKDMSGISMKTSTFKVLYTYM